MTDTEGRLDDWWAHLDEILRSRAIAEVHNHPPDEIAETLDRAGWTLEPGRAEDIGNVSFHWPPEVRTFVERKRDERDR